MPGYENITQTSTGEVRNSYSITASRTASSPLMINGDVPLHQKQTLLPTSDDTLDDTLPELKVFHPQTSLPFTMKERKGSSIASSCPHKMIPLTREMPSILVYLTRYMSNEPHSLPPLQQSRTHKRKVRH